MKSILNVEVSCFANYREPENPRTVNLIKWLQSDKYKTQVDLIRTTSDKHERDRLKSSLPSITPSGLFKYRNASALIKHSKLICLDIDLKGNEGLSYYADLKQYICHIPNVAYCGYSVSGTGYFVLIPIASPNHHKSHFEALRSLFQERFSIRVDNTGDVSRLRGYSFDESAFFRHDAIPFIRLHAQPVIKPIVGTNNHHKTNECSNQSSLLQRCIAIIESAEEGNKHDQLLRASTLAGGFIASGLLNEQSTIIALEQAISLKPNVKSLDSAKKTILDGVKNGKLRPIYT